MLSLRILITMLAIATINVIVVKAAPDPHPSEKSKDSQSQKRKAVDTSTSTEWDDNQELVFMHYSRIMSYGKGTASHAKQVNERMKASPQKVADAYEKARERSNK